MAKPTLHLNLTKKWFDMILSGEKKEEYRALKPYWSRVFSTGKVKIKGTIYPANGVVICFSNGYHKERRQMWVELKDVVIDTGKLGWGAIKHEKYYVLKLGEVLISRDPQATNDLG